MAINLLDLSLAAKTLFRRMSFIWDHFPNSLIQRMLCG
jgi:hypothetical protein